MEFQAEDMEVRMSRNRWAGYRKEKRLTLEKSILAEVVVFLPLENVALWPDCALLILAVVST